MDIGMARITRHSTRLMGFHLRQYRKAEGDETEMFSARIYLGETEAGIARNGGTGGPDMIDVWSPHREAWDRLARYLEEHPIAVEEDGTRDEYVSGEEAALMILRDLHDAEQSLSRSRKYHSGLVAYTWERPFEGSSWWATAHVLFSGAPEVSPNDADPGLFRILVLGVDNERFAREAAPLPGHRA
jgi:hypothetical protein